MIEGSGVCTQEVSVRHWGSRGTAAAVTLIYYVLLTRSAEGGRGGLGSVFWRGGIITYFLLNRDSFTRAFTSSTTPQDNSNKTNSNSSQVLMTT